MQKATSKVKAEAEIRPVKMFSKTEDFDGCTEAQSSSACQKDHSFSQHACAPTKVKIQVCKL